MSEAWHRGWQVYLRPSLLMNGVSWTTLTAPHNWPVVAPEEAPHG